jgi:hypothetical protein
MERTAILTSLEHEIEQILLEDNEILRRSSGPGSDKEEFILSNPRLSLLYFQLHIAVYRAALAKVREFMNTK